MTKQINKFFVFTDLSDYTLKSSLLTPKQLKEFIIDKQDELILPLIKEFNWELVKYIWDSYLVFFDSASSSLNFSLKLLEVIHAYNINIKLNLKKIELKIVINYGSLIKKRTKLWYDYFWDSLNISSRILKTIPKNIIFFTKPIYEKIKNRKLDINYLWDKSYRWVIYKIPLYSINWNSTEINNNLDNYNDIIKKVDDCIFKISSVSFLLTLQPMPLADRYFMVLLHLYLLKKVALLYWIKLSKKQIKEIVSTIFISISGMYTTSQIVTWLWKIWLPFLWWYLLAPLNFSITFSLWKVFSNYFYYKSQKTNLTSYEIKDIFVWTKEKWLIIAKEQKDDILSTWREYKDMIIKQVIKLNDIYKEIKDYIKSKK